MKKMETASCAEEAKISSTWVSMGSPHSSSTLFAAMETTHSFNAASIKFTLNVFWIFLRTASRWDAPSVGRFVTYCCLLRQGWRMKNCSRNSMKDWNWSRFFRLKKSKWAVWTPTSRRAFCMPFLWTWWGGNLWMKKKLNSIASSCKSLKVDMRRCQRQKRISSRRISLKDIRSLLLQKATLFSNSSS